MSGPKLPNIAELISAGINPSNGTPLRWGLSELSQDITKIIRITDEQDAVNRYQWYNLPDGITSQMLERLLYYKGQIAMFYMPDADMFMFLPYAGTGSINCYGEWNYLRPIVIGKNGEKEVTFMDDLVLKIQKQVILPEDLKESDWRELAVIVRDYTPQLSQTIIPRQQLNDPLCRFESEMLPFCRTSLINSCGVNGVRVPDADSKQMVDDASRSMEDAAKNGKPWIAITGAIEFQELANGPVAKAEDFLMTMQSVDNLRLSTYGLDNGGLFEKKAHILQSENAMNGQNNKTVYLDGLKNRQQFCNIANSIWGLGIWCDVPEFGMAINGVDVPELPMENNEEEGEDNASDSTVSTQDSN